MPALLAAALVGLSSAGGQGPVTAQTTAPTEADYAWADSCKKCHEEIYEAWAHTKHARALDRLSGGDQQKECIGCHVTGPKSRVEQGGKVANAGIQCEGCHGPAKAHVADPAVRTGLARKPAEAVCVACHNDKSPHYRGFYYSAMIGFSHYIRK